MRNVLIIGLGEIGKPLYTIIQELGKFNVYGFDVDKSKYAGDGAEIPKSIDIMHICIPCKDMALFVKIISSYYKTYTPKLIIINSTVPPRTTHFVADVLQEYKVANKPDCLIVHSPMFGTHYNKDSMKDQFIYYPHLIGGINKESSQAAYEYFNELNLSSIIMSSPLESEIMKIMETTYAGWMITFFVEFHRLTESFGADFPEIVEALSKTYEPRCEKPIWFPSVIEGHCVMQNIDLMLQAYDIGFLHLIKESNDFRKEEINEDEKLKLDIEKIKLIKERMKNGKS